MGVSEYREFIALACCLNFTTAAEQLNLTQPALSKHIASLEKEFSAPLFTREHRGLRLTEAGKTVLEMSCAIVGAYDSAREAVERLSREKPIRIDGTLYDEVVSSIIALTTALLKNDDRPSIVVEHREDSSLINLLVSGQIDILLSFIDDEDMRRWGLSSFHLTRSQFVAILDSDNPLASRDGLHLEDLRDMTFIQCIDDYSSSGWACIERACRNHGFTPKKRPVLGGPAVYSTTQPNGGVFIEQRNLHRNKLLEGNAGISIVPIVDDDTRVSSSTASTVPTTKSGCTRCWKPFARPATSSNGTGTRDSARVGGAGGGVADEGPASDGLTGEGLAGGVGGRAGGVGEHAGGRFFTECVLLEKYWSKSQRVHAG